jgi:hypothetical protein
MSQHGLGLLAVLAHLLAVQITVRELETGHQLGVTGESTLEIVIVGVGWEVRLLEFSLEVEFLLCHSLDK